MRAEEEDKKGGDRAEEEEKKRWVRLNKKTEGMGVGVGWSEVRGLKKNIKIGSGD